MVSPLMSWLRFFLKFIVLLHTMILSKDHHCCQFFLSHIPRIFITFFSTSRHIPIKNHT